MQQNKNTEQHKTLKITLEELTRGKTEYLRELQIKLKYIHLKSAKKQTEYSKKQNVNALKKPLAFQPFFQCIGSLRRIAKD